MSHTESLFVSDGEDDEKIQYGQQEVRGEKKNLGDINRHQQDDNLEGLLNEHTMEETERSYSYYGRQRRRRASGGREFMWRRQAEPQ